MKVKWKELRRAFKINLMDGENLRGVKNIIMINYHLLVYSLIISLIFTEKDGDH